LLNVFEKEADNNEWCGIRYLKDTVIGSNQKLTWKQVRDGVDNLAFDNSVKRFGLSVFHVN